MIMGFFLYLVFFLFGITVGSFLNCIIYRLDTKEGFFTGRSYCPNCRHVLSWRDLIPIFSFVILRGKCRYCKKPISWQYPLVEFATGVLFLLPTIVQTPISAELTGYYPGKLFFYWLFISFLIIIFVYDLKHYIIPDKIIYPAIGGAFLYQLLISDFGFQISGFRPLIYPLLSAFLASAFFLLIVLGSRGKWMGLGDVKLAFFMGLLLGFPNILIGLFLAFFIGAIIGTGLIVLRKKNFRSEIPFGPFLVTGTLISLFWGEKIINWYLFLIY